MSAVVPAYNAAAFIERTLQSVCRQSWSDLEILVVDDGSRDGTADIVRRMAVEDPRIRLLAQENQGVSAARNQGIRHARGDYIALLDADDLWMPEKISRQMQVFADSPRQVGLVYTQSVRIFEDGRPPIYSGGGEAEGRVFFPLMIGNFLQNASTPLIRRTCFDKAGLFNLEFRKQGAQGCEDWDIYLRIAEHYEFRVIRDYLTGYRQNPDGMSANWETMLRSYRLLIDEVRRRHPDIPDRVFRWSRSNYNLYLANMASRAGQAGSAVRLLGQAIADDPLLLSNRRLHKMFARTLLRGRRAYRGGGAPASAPDIAPTQGDAPGGGRLPPTGPVWRFFLKLRRKQLARLERTLRSLNPDAAAGEVAENIQRE